MKPIPPAIREYVLKRDHYKCVICGRPATDVHHVYTRNSFIPAFLEVPPTKKNMHPWNLISVCHSCHRRIHDKGLPDGTKEAMVKTNKELSCVHFDEELEKRMEKELEKLKGKV
jgi:5-methylcytosine-specific restriction endonuclease McrA